MKLFYEIYRAFPPPHPLKTPPNESVRGSSDKDSNSNYLHEKTHARYSPIFSKNKRFVQPEFAEQYPFVEYVFLGLTFAVGKP